EGSGAPPTVSLDLLETVSSAAGLGDRVLHALLRCGDADLGRLARPLLPFEGGLGGESRPVGPTQLLLLAAERDDAERPNRARFPNQAHRGLLVAFHAERRGS